MCLHMCVICLCDRHELVLHFWLVRQKCVCLRDCGEGERAMAGQHTGASESEVTLRGRRGRRMIGGEGGGKHDTSEK